MKNTFLLVAIVLATHAQAQLITNTMYYETGISVGAMNNRTDISRQFHFRFSAPNASVYTGLMYKNTLGVRLEFTMGSVQGADSVNNDNLKARNLSFKSKISELSMMFEFHPLMIRGWDADIPPNYSSYIIAGIGFFSYNPRAQLNGTWYDLRPLRLEGQGFAEYPDRKIYSLTALCFPIGFGLKKEFSTKWNLRIEGVYRFTNTDYLDDVSTRIVDPNLFDKYLSPADAAIAKQLYNRADPSNTGYKVGNQRGNPKYTDGYLNLNLKLGYCFGRQPAKKR